MTVHENFLETLEQDVDFSNKRISKYLDIIYKNHTRSDIALGQELRFDQSKRAKRKAIKTVEAALADSRLNLKDKDYIACVAADLRPATLWVLERFGAPVLHSVFAMRNVRGDNELLQALFKNQPFDKENCTIALQSLNFFGAWTIVENGVTMNGAVAFVQNFDDAFFMEMAPALFAEHKRMRLSLPDLASRARKLYNLDESIPDEWIAQMFT